jgi:hypothetical protein
MEGKAIFKNVFRSFLFIIFLVTLITAVKNLINPPTGTTVYGTTESEYPSLTFCPLNYDKTIPVIARYTNSTFDDIYNKLPSMKDKLNITMNLEFQYSLNGYVCMLTYSYNTCKANSNIFRHLYVFNAKDDSKLKKHFNRTVDDIWVENLGVVVEEPFYVQRCVTLTSQCHQMLQKLKLVLL